MWWSMYTYIADLQEVVQNLKRKSIARQSAMAAGSGSCMQHQQRHVGFPSLLFLLYFLSSLGCFFFLLSYWRIHLPYAACKIYARHVSCG